MADKHGLMFFDTSSKTGKNVDEAFTAIAKEIKVKQIDPFTPYGD